MAVKIIDLRRALAASAWFRECPPAFQEALTAAGEIVSYGHGDYLFRANETASGLFCLLDGRLRVSTPGLGSRDSILAIVEAPFWLGELVLFDQLQNSSDARCEGPATVFVVPDAALRVILEREPRYWREIGLLMAGKTRLAFRSIADNATGPSQMRMAGMILTIARGYDAHAAPSRAEISTSQDQLGQMLGMSRQTVNQILAKLEEQAIIRRHYGGIELLDAGKLAEIAGAAS